MNRSSKRRNSRLLATAVACLLFLPGFSEENEGSSSEELDWESLIEETEEILAWSEDPFADIEDDYFSVALWSASLRAGAGETSNFLKRHDAVSSRFLKTEGNIFYNILFKKSALTALVYAEYVSYERDSEVDGETLAFAHFSWARFFDSWSIGAEGTAFYGDQVYDASQTISSEPVGASLRQFRPKPAFFAEWNPREADVLKTSISMERALFNQSEDDYWKPELSIEWTHAWTPALSSKSEVAVFREFYDDENPRSRIGLPLSDTDELEITGLSLEQLIQWESFLIESLDFSLRAGLSREYEEEGQYKGLTRLWGSAKLSYEWDAMELSLVGRWQKTGYADRQTSFLDARPLSHIYRHLKIEVSRDLPWSTFMRLNVQWTDLQSRNEEDSFSERRIEAIFGWTY